VTQCIDNEIQRIYNALTTSCNTFSGHNAFALNFLVAGFCKEGHIYVCDACAEKEVVCEECQERFLDDTEELGLDKILCRHCRDI